MAYESGLTTAPEIPKRDHIPRGNTRNSTLNTKLALQLRDLFVPAVVAHLFYHLARRIQMLPRLFLPPLRQVQAGAFQVAIGLVEPHPASRGEGHGFFQIPKPCSDGFGDNDLEFYFSFLFFNYLLDYFIILLYKQFFNWIVQKKKKASD